MRPGRALPALGLGLALVLACAPAGSDSAEIEFRASAIEARFGNGCRAVDPVAPVLEFLEGLSPDWQPFWTEPEETAFVLTLMVDGRPVQRVGLGAGSATLETTGGRLFRQMTSAESERLVELAGGVPLGDELGSCAASDQPLEESA